MMKTKTSLLTTFLAALALAAGCTPVPPAATQTPTPTPSEASSPTITRTPIPFPTYTSTPTIPTFTPTETDTPLPTITATKAGAGNSQPASLAGTISLSDGSKKPFVTSIELRQGKSFTLIARGGTDASGAYKLDIATPGTYELWVLITSNQAMLPGCADVAPPDNSWKIGIKFGEDKALTMENAYLSKALLLAQNLTSPDLKAQGFYAVRSALVIEAGAENKQDVALACK